MSAVLLLAKKEFRHFVQLVFHTLNPTQSLSWNWHLDYLCSQLELTLPNAPQEKKIYRLIINIPPRSLKSIITNVAYKAFLLGHFPHERVIAASYSARLSDKFNSDTRRIMESPWYQQMFPNTILQKKTDAKFTTTLNGHSISTSVGGTVTGEGGNYLICDDILNPEQASSEVERNNANDWFSHTFSSRLDSQKTGVIIVVMQRLAEDDLTGHLLSAQKDTSVSNKFRWQHICLPVIATRDSTYRYYNTQKEVRVGDLLHEERLSHDTIQALRASLGSYAFAGQYLQTPAPEDGGILNPRWLRYAVTLPAEKDIIRVIQSWDTAIKASSSKHDFSVGQTWWETPHGYYLVDQVCEKLEYPDLKRRVVHFATIHHPQVILIEDKASGQQLIQDFRQETRLPIVPIAPKGDKVTRAAGASPTLEAGKVFLPPNATTLPWYDEFISQLLLFPNAQHDDCVDCLTQFVLWATRSSSNNFNIRVL
ncbi:MAG: hypothetical protein A2Y53_05725 [Chloroflexi bacterium RBG_16_47_49]|nr:MAG: hypothetical protein A2Y53_05725 [Chloroflexi bacterium RBG_16_47_49]